MTDGPTGERTRVPLFPLSLVLFPGTQLPLHIFEPRYRAMIADTRAADGRFGIVLRTADDERAIPPDHVGCYAIIREAVPLGDGRTNILVDAGERFAVQRLIDAGTPYHVAEVRPFRDEPVSDPDALADAARRARAAYARITRSAQTLADEIGPAGPIAGTAPTVGAADAWSAPPGVADMGTTAVQPPALPADDTLLAFAVASTIELELATRQRVLASPDPVERTTYVARLLERALPDVESRAALHTRARSNGHGPHDASGASA